MTDIAKIEAPKPLVKYYKYEEPIAAYPPSYYQKVGDEYRGFIIIREGEYLLYSIRTKEDGKPPIPLRSSFTNKAKAIESIDDFLEREEVNKAVSETIQ